MASQDRNTPYNAKCVSPSEVEQALASAQLPPPILRLTSTPIFQASSSTRVRLTEDEKG
ncbi:hypothetical protein L211DRAFT_837653 [Terfezia boudieri ATCC MYA-4762]|uniref:Uncharacterized protein n=1 Tax=Terfezia boudieri ATCC MYA-4762 TaxID=1051890 RepID=A0A3N4LN56_9PEZI|nr:hypothetical protein L211DRAFT_837653 [Terfezia boudieri ATCC MYA-4762]